jgi:UDP-N-acetylglucosamine acyltransferase
MIHNLAIVDKNSQIAKDADIGPYAIVEPGVKIGAGVKIWPHAYICGGTEIGDGTEVHMGAVLGHAPQDLAYKGGDTKLVIGKRNVIREYATVHRGTKDSSATVLGDENYLMALSHVGHNCEIGNRVILANCALLGGYVKVEDGAFISGNVAVHQFCRIGTLAMIGGFSGVNKDVPPYMLLRGPSIIRSVNLVGLRRAKIPPEAIRKIKEAFRLLYRANLNISQAIEEMRKLGPSKELEDIIKFIETSKRGICNYAFTEEEYFESE